MRSRSRARRQGLKANIDMNSLIDLTFLLLVVFIVTLPTLEQSVPILLPTDKVEEPKDEKKQEKPLFVTVDAQGKTFVGEVPTTLDDLKAIVQKGVADNPEEYAVVIRGDVRGSYGDVYEVFKIARECNVRKLALVSKEN